MIRFSSGSQTVELDGYAFGFTRPADLGEVWQETEGGDWYCYVKRPVRREFGQLRFTDLSQAKKDELMGFLESVRGGVSFTLTDHDGTQYTVRNRTPKPAPRYEGMDRWSLVIDLEVVG